MVKATESQLRTQLNKVTAAKGRKEETLRKGKLPYPCFSCRRLRNCSADSTGAAEDSPSLRVRASPSGAQPPTGVLGSRGKKSAGED